MYGSVNMRAVTTSESRLCRLVPRVQRGAKHVQHKHVVIAEVQLVPLVPVALLPGPSSAGPVNNGGNEPTTEPDARLQVKNQSPDAWHSGVADALHPSRPASTVRQEASVSRSQLHTWWTSRSTIMKRRTRPPDARRSCRMARKMSLYAHQPPPSCRETPLEPSAGVIAILGF